MNRTRRVILGVLAASLLLVAATQAQGAPAIGWSAIGGGGGSATAGNHTLESAVGQWAASGVGQGSVQLTSGFLGGARLGSPTAVTLRAFTARAGRLGLSLGGLALVALGIVGLALAGRRAWHRRHLKSNL